MSKENILINELLKLDANTFKRLLNVWNLKNIPKDKKGQIKQFISAMENEFYLKGILEKLTPNQVQIYMEILNSQEKVLTLGEISKKFNIPPNSAEVELGVLKRYFLVYQKKNRERLTNTLDKYYVYPQNIGVIQYQTNKNGERFNQTIVEILARKKKENKDNINPIWKTKEKFTQEEIKNNLEKIFNKLTEVEEELFLTAFQQGGILEIETAREIIEKHKETWEKVITNLNELLILIDDYYFDDKFIRILVIPNDAFQYAVANPIIPKSPKGVKKGLEKVSENQLDFFINLKKAIVYILKRSLTLSKSGKIRQSDLRDTENFFLPIDIELFKEKSQIYQIELLLPIMRILDIVRIKKDDVVLRNDWEDYLKLNTIEIHKRVIKAIEDTEEKTSSFEEVFNPMYVPFYKKKVFQSVIKILLKQQRNIYYTIIALLVRENLILTKNFSIKQFPELYSNYTKEIISVLFYLQLFGYLKVEYPDRWISFSDLGLFFLKKKPLKKESEKGAIVINPDLTIIAFPEKLTLEHLYFLKVFCELKSFENIYTFQLTRDSFLNAYLMKEDIDKFLSILKEYSISELPQNLNFSINDWKKNIPLVTIIDECVLVKTKDPNHMELLLAQIENKDTLIEQLSPTTIVIEPQSIPEIIEIGERLNLLIKLIR